MKKLLTAFVVSLILLAGLSRVALVQEKPHDKPADKEKAKEKEKEKDADEEAIHESATSFIAAYNAHDAKAVALLFSPKAEFTDEDGNLIKGREAIEQDFAELFTKHPDCKIEVDIDSIRVLTPNVAVEEGVVRGHPVPDESQKISSYVAIHVKIDGKWLIGSVNDFEAHPEDLTPNEHLQELAWMVGDWIDESTDSTIKSHCRWDDSESYLLHEFHLQIDGQISSTGSMRIGWDPLTRQIKSWTFDADSGHSEALWTHVDDEWIVTSHGVNESGQVMSSTNVFRLIDNDTMTWRSYDRVVGGESQDDISENVIKRHTSSPEG